MPRAVPTPCRYPGCPALSDNTYCPTHTQQINRNYERHRPQAFKRFYSNVQWRRVRAMKLSRDPLCQSCAERGRTTPATEVHHIIERRDRPDLALAMDNLQSLCKSCHSVHSMRRLNEQRVGLSKS